MIYFEFFKESLQLIKEDRMDDLKQNIIDFVRNAEKTSANTKTFEEVMAILNKPIIRKELDKWADISGLSGLKVVNLVEDIIIKSNLTVEHKIEMAQIMGSGKPLLDFSKMIKDSTNRAVAASAYYNHKVYADILFKATAHLNDKQLLGAPTNIGKGEVAFVVTGNLGKPRQGDLEDGNNVIEVKEPSAAINPKGVSHPSKHLSEMRKFIRRLGYDEYLPKADRFAGKGGNASNSLSYLLEVYWSGGKARWPLGDWAKENNIPIKRVKEIFQHMHDLSYPMKIDVSRFVKTNYTLDFAGYGALTFSELYEAYRKQSSFNTLMVFDIKSSKVYSVKTKSDAIEMWKKFGEIKFNGNDNHALDGAHGGKLYATAMKRAMK